MCYRGNVQFTWATTGGAPVSCTEGLMFFHSPILGWYTLGFINTTGGVQNIYVTDPAVAAAAGGVHFMTLAFFWGLAPDWQIRVHGALKTGPGVDEPAGTDVF